tara:strand:+ start:692 stop:949 length:258 start_codon:yes stop_codon:yes gene_type:complete
MIVLLFSAMFIISGTALVVTRDLRENGESSVYSLAEEVIQTGTKQAASGLVALLQVAVFLLLVGVAGLAGFWIISRIVSFILWIF